MKRYYMYKVVLDSGVEFQAKLEDVDVERFEAWANNAAGVASAELIKATNRVEPHSAQRTKMAFIRVTSGITQQEMADKLGVHLSVYQRWENGKHAPKTKTLMKIGDVLGVDWTTLIEED